MATDKDMSLVEASKLLSEKNISSIIVMKDNKIKGIITEEDIIKNYGKKSKLFEIMHKNVVTVSINDEVKDAIKTINKRKISILPVVEKGNLVGVISGTDILKYFKESGDFLLD